MANQKERQEILNKIGELVNQFNETNPQKDTENFNGLLLIASVQIEGEAEITNNEGQPIEKPVKEITAIVGRREDVMNTILKTMFTNENIYHIFQECISIVMTEKVQTNLSKFKK